MAPHSLSFSKTKTKFLLLLKSNKKPVGTKFIFNFIHITSTLNEFPKLECSVCVSIRYSTNASKSMRQVFTLLKNTDYKMPKTHTSTECGKLPTFE